MSSLDTSSPKPGLRERKKRQTRENMAFPTFYKGGAHSGSAQARLACTGPIKYTGHKQLAEDIANLKSALGADAPVGVFMPSVSLASSARLTAEDFSASWVRSCSGILSPCSRSIFSA